MQNKVCGKKYADGLKFPPIHTDSGAADKYSISVKKQAFDSFKKCFLWFSFIYKYSQNLQSVVARDDYFSYLYGEY